MASDFEGVKKQLLDLEGGYTNSARDFGGETKYGISKRQYPGVDIKNLTFDQACVILERDYWNRYQLYKISNQIIANKLFFGYINMNPLEIGRIAQRATNAVGYNLLIDGILGIQTVDAINQSPPAIMLDKLRIELCKFYLLKVQSDESQVPNLPSWIRRALV